MSISKRNIETIKNIIIGFLIGVVVALWMSLVRVCIEKDSLEEMMAPPSSPKIKREVPKDYERAKSLMPIVPASPLTDEELLSLASMFPEVFTDQEIVTLLVE
jgi:hypothetical protein